MIITTGFLIIFNQPHGDYLALASSLFRYECHCAGEGPASIGAGARDLRPVVICGFGELGQSVVNMLESPLSQTLERGQVPYVAFDLQPARIKAARAAGFNVLYG